MNIGNTDRNQDHARPLVLHVEDNEARRYSVAHSLNRAGFEVLEAESGEEGISLATRDPALIVLDINLPGINGFEVCRRLKSNPKTKHIPILHLSASNIRTSDKTTALELGADAYLTEPVESSEFVATVNALLRIRRSEEQARHLARRWASTFAAIRDGICLIDNAGRVVERNPAFCELLGEHSDCTGEGSAAATDASLIAGIESHFGEVCPQIREILKVPYTNAEVECQLAQNWFRITLNPLKDEERILGAVVVMTEITEKKAASHRIEELAEHLRRSNRDLEHFASVVSHDLQEPLRTVANFVSLLERTGVAKQHEQAQVYIQYAVSGARRMKTMIDDLLQYSRFSVAPMQSSPVDTNQAVQRALDNLASAAREADAHFFFEALPAVWGDAAQLSRLFQNLIGNAIKFRRGPGPEIRISADEEQGQHVITIADNGIGFDMHNAAQIFDIFYRLHRGEEYSGSGVGLSVCRRIVERHGGSIRVQSAPGQGSSFQVVLPKQPELH